MSEYYKTKHSAEDSARPLIEKKLKRLFDLRAVKYIGDERDGILYDKDFVGYDKNGRRITFEVKVRMPREDRKRGYSDIAVETASNSERGTPGWIHTSRADWLVYVFLRRNGELGRVYVLDMKELRRWFLENEHRYPTLRAPNPPDNPRYHTLFKPVPIRDIPEFLFLFGRRAL